MREAGAGIGWRAVVVLLAASLASCGSGGGDPGGSATTTTTHPPAEATHRVPAVTGVATAFEQLVPQVDLDAHPEREPIAAPPGTLELAGCRWRGPGLMTFDLAWSSTATVEYPVTFTLRLERLHGDMGEGSAGDVTLRGPGRFSVTEDDAPNQAVYRRRTPVSESLPEWEAARYEREDELAQSCSASVASDRRVPPGSSYVRPTVDPIDVVGPAAAGTVEALARGVDLEDPADRLLPLAYLVRATDLPALDRLFLSDAGWLEHVSVKRDSTCIRASVTMTVAGPARRERLVEIQQRRGCPASDVIEQHEPGVVPVRVDDPEWQVTLTGARADVDVIRGGLRGVPFDGVDPSEAGFDPDAYIDGVLEQRPDLTEVARFDWAGGRLSIVHRPGIDIEGYSDPILATTKLPQSTSRDGLVCVTHAIDIRTGPTDGYVAIVLQEPGLVAELHRAGRAPERLATVPGAGGSRVAFVDLDGGEQLTTEDVVVLDSRGVPLECDQSF